MTTRRPSAPPAPDITIPARHNQREPRLPHEHDQSSDSQRAATEQATEVGRQGARDVARGLVDTDRGPVIERINDTHFAPARPAPPVRRKRA